MLNPIPAQPSQPQTAWLYWLGSFILLYGALLYFYLLWIWPLGGFTAGLGRHAGYYWEWVRAVYVHDRASAIKWRLYVDFMTHHALWTPFLLRVAGGVFLLPLLVIGLLSRFSFQNDVEKHVRGLRYEPDFKRSEQIALTHLRAMLRKGEKMRDWFKIHPRIPISPMLTNTGLLCIGAVGSGKTNFLMPLLQQVVASPHRSLILDVKGDYTACLRYPQNEFILLAPWDQRGWRWDIAKDVTTLSQARLFAESCIPPSDEPIWSTGARQVFAGIMHHLCKTQPCNWTLFDFIKLTRLPDNQLMGIIYDGNPDAARVIMNLSDGNRTGQSIMINMGAFIGPLADLAWSWERNPEAPTFSLRDWLAGDTELPRGILIQSRRAFGEVSEAMINALVTLLTNRIVDTAFPESDARPDDWRLYLALDEIAQSRKIEALQSLSSAGRSKGLHLIVGIQSITQLKKIYSPEFADLLYTNLLTRYIGRTPDGDSAEWIARKLSVQEVERLKNSRSNTQAEAGLSSQESWDWTRESKRVLLPSQLSSDLGPDYKKGHIRALLSVSGWSHVLRMAWPHFKETAVRPAMMEAKWLMANQKKPEAAP